VDSPHSKSNYSPSTKDMLAQKELMADFSPSKAAAVAAAAFTSSQAMVAAATAAALNDSFLMQNRFPRGFKPWVKCRLCGKGWKGKDNFFTHLVSTHFKYLWAAEVPKHADMFQCHVGTCNYQSKYRYNFLFHLVPDVIKHFFFVVIKGQSKLAFVPCKPFLPCLLFVSRAGAPLWGSHQT